MSNYPAKAVINVSAVIDSLAAGVVMGASLGGLVSTFTGQPLAAMILGADIGGACGLILCILWCGGSKIEAPSQSKQRSSVRLCFRSKLVHPLVEIRRRQPSYRAAPSNISAILVSLQIPGAVKILWRQINSARGTHLLRFKWLISSLGPSVKLLRAWISRRERNSAREARASSEYGAFPTFYPPSTLSDESISEIAANESERSVDGNGRSFLGADGDHVFNEAVAVFCQNFDRRLSVNRSG